MDTFMNESGKRSINYLICFLVTSSLVCSLYNSISAQDALKAPIVFIKATADWEETGTGFLVGQKDEELYLFTAAHVIENATDVRLDFYQGPQEVKAEVVLINEGLDLAAIKCPMPTGYSPPSSFAAAKEGEKIRQAVIVIGHPADSRWDINYNSNVKTTDYDLDSRLHTLDPAGIAPGSSGGPVLTLQYELLGLVGENNAVRAIAVDMSTILKACEAWDVPVNLLTGIKIEEPITTAGKDDFRYRLFVQEANTAFADGKWEQAKRAFEQAQAILPSTEFEQKIQQCEIEKARDLAYQRYFEQGKAAVTLTDALSNYQKAQQQRNTEAVRELIQQVKEKMTGKIITTPPPDDLPDRYTDPFAGTMVLVERGTFTMGCDTCEADQWPAHEVSLDHFYIGEHKVTVQAFCQFLNEWASDTEIIFHGDIRTEKKGRSFVYTPADGAGNTSMRVNWVVYFAPYMLIQHYCWWLGRKTGYVYRLPTEAEWEYAAGGGQNSHGWLFSGYDNIDSLSYGETKPNELGIFNMSQGNYEICSDWYDPNYYESCKKEGTVFNPQGPISGSHRVGRGRLVTSRYQDAGAFRLVREPYSVYAGMELSPDFIERHMVLVEGGAFLMGDPDSKSDVDLPHEVTLDSYYISKIELTEEQWDLVTGLLDHDYPESYGPCRPATASWYQVDTFISRLNALTGMNYRLPTEAEWEYAARGGKLGHGNNYTYAGSDKLDEVGWQEWDYIGRNSPHRVAQKKPNQLGLYDMSGNAVEWCRDWYIRDYYRDSPKHNPPGPSLSPYKVVRGKDAISTRIAYDPNFNVQELGRLFSDDDLIGIRLVRPKGVSPVAPEFQDPFENEMIRIEGGSATIQGAFEYGTYKFYEADIEPFYLASQEVTQAQWKQVMGYASDQEAYCGECPVVNVSLSEIRLFINTLNRATGRKYRLPFEAEWVWAAQGAADKLYQTWAGTDNEDELFRYANY
ncbi:MAG: SUMF1/EgtB/PvdO family nonheme iron enzyme, partial [Lewinella sp.]|nr:SUMF1/EgtB/PvdO family nonheme iron enzyme [Lewinella sp.]